MHKMAFITLGTEHAASSIGARRQVYNTLREEGFDLETMFVRGVARKYRIGGQYSGLLGINSLEQDQIQTYYDFREKSFFRFETFNCFVKALEDFYAQFPNFQGCPPMHRTSSLAEHDWDPYGYEDDAMIVTDNIYENILLDFEDTCEEPGKFWDLEEDYVHTDFIGNKWIVLVDYIRL